MGKNDDGFAEAEKKIERAWGEASTELDLSRLDLIRVPDSIGQLNQLQVLHLSSNQLTNLPESIGQLTQLQRLDLEDNQLAALPEAIGQLSQLQELDLEGNQLTALPEAIGQLSQLQELGLNGNQLTSLPDAVGQLTQLQELTLMGSQLTSLPEAIGQLNQLLLLDLDDNQLTLLPEAIGQLNQLQLLYLRNNQLCSLTNSLGNLKSLEVFYLHNNQALDLPIEVLGPDIGEEGKWSPPAKPSDILDYYFRTKGGKRPLNEAKLILVGRGAVGKTSLVNRLVHNSFDKDEKKTDGIKITEWSLRLNGDEDICLNVWDFGGQEIMHSTHQFFLTQRSLYLLVLNGREGGEDAEAEYWLKLIASFGQESPVIMVLNKVADHPFDLNRRALQKKYPAIKGFIKTDCEAEIGINELVEIIEKETDQLEHLRDAFPASWFTIKDKLSRMEGNYLSFDAYCKVCEKEGETDEAAQEALAGYLHNLGVVLNYREDPRLQDTHVLNPHWVTGGIYKLLNSEKLEAQKGEIRLNDLTDILDKKDYPANMRCFIFDLMKKFDLCFSFPGEETHYLVPDLLDKQEPEEAAIFDAEQCLNFQYHYPVLPEGLLPRFIVRTHVLSENQARWRSGVILAFEGCRALVKADAQDKKVFISVSGPQPARRRLLAVIRSDFECIHNDIRNLKPQQMVPLPEEPKVVVSYDELIVMERNGIKTFPKVVDEQVVEVDVHDLLNGVDLEGSRKRDKVTDYSKPAVRLFYSYSHKDEDLRNELETHLKLLQRQRAIDTWHDREIKAGDGWKDKIDENLERADIILLLVSSDFIASDYCYEKEMTRAIERHEAGEATVIPVIVRDVNWVSAPFAKIQALPKNGEAVTLWDDKDTAWRNVSEGIEKVVKGITS